MKMKAPATHNDAPPINMTSTHNGSMCYPLSANRRCVQYSAACDSCHRHVASSQCSILSSPRRRGPMHRNNSGFPPAPKAPLVLKRNARGGMTDATLPLPPNNKVSVLSCPQMTGTMHSRLHVTHSWSIINCCVSKPMKTRGHYERSGQFCNIPSRQGSQCQLVRRKICAHHQGKWPPLQAGTDEYYYRRKLGRGYEGCRQVLQGNTQRF